MQTKVATTPLVTYITNLIDLNVDHDRNDETRNVEILDDGDFPASTPNFHTNESEAPEVCTLTQEEVNEQTKSFIAPLARQPEDLTRLVQILLVASHPNHYPRADTDTGRNAHGYSLDKQLWAKTAAPKVVPSWTPEANEDEGPVIHTITQEEVDEQIKCFLAPLTRQLQDLARFVRGMATALHPNYYPMEGTSSNLSAPEYQFDNTGKRNLDLANCSYQ